MQMRSWEPSQHGLLAVLDCCHCHAACCPAGVVAPQAEQVPTPGDASPTEQHHKLELQNRRIADLDIFADDVAEVLEQSKAAVAAQPAGGANPALQDNYDDAEGYYNFQVSLVLQHLLCQAQAACGHSRQQDQSRADGCDCGAALTDVMLLLTAGVHTC